MIGLIKLSNISN